MLSIVLSLAIGAHPIHTTSAVLVLTPNEPSARLTLRLFADDFPPGRDPTAMARYLTGRVTFTEPNGQILPLSLDTIDEADGVVTLQVAVSSPRGWRGVTVQNQVLCERFRDQVNVVQIRIGGRSTMLLFTPGTSAKPVW